MVPQPTITWSATAGSVSAAGLFTAGSSPGSATVSASAGGKTGSGAVTVTLAPSITSPPTVNGPVTINVPVTFSSNATDPAGGTLTYHWTFGDGSSTNGATVTHTYTSAGNFTLTLTITSSLSGGSTTMTLNITVVDPNAGGGTGGTGGTGGAGGSASVLNEMSFSKVSGSINFTSQNKDAASFSGLIPGLPAGFDPTGVQVTLKIGAATVLFTLDAKGRAHNDSGSIALTLKGKRDPKTKKTVFSGGAAPVKGKIAHGTWWQTWGFDPAVPAPATITLELDLNSTRYGATVAITAQKDSKHGKFKH
jgi:PKD repeat protein